MLRVFLLLVFGLFHCQNLFAEPTVQQIYSGRASRILGPFGDMDVVTPNHTIYGGISGPDCSTTSETLTCNNCDTEDLTQSCNTKRIHDSLLFSIRIVADREGFVLVTNDYDQGSGGTVELLSFSSDVSKTLPVANGQTVLVNVTWREICRKVFNSTNGCKDVTSDNLGQKRLRVGISENGTSLQSGEYVSNLQFVLADIGSGQTELCNEDSATEDIVGACNFIAYPGDEKVFVESIQGNCSLPSLSDSAAAARSLRLYYSDSSFPNRRTATFTDLRLEETQSSTCTTTRTLALRGGSSAGGLKNDTPYFFAMGVVDAANNVGLVTNMDPDDSSIASTDPDDPSGCYQPAGGDWSKNCHVSTPREVIGMIQDEFDCFVATAAYGSALEGKVIDLRAFRDQFLKTNKLGRAIIKFYYQYSPPLARWVANKPWRRSLAQTLIWPVWGIAFLFNYFGGWTLSLLLTSFVILLDAKRRRRTTKRGSL